MESIRRRRDEGQYMDIGRDLGYLGLLEPGDRRGQTTVGSVDGTGKAQDDRDCRSWRRRTAAAEELTVLTLWLLLLLLPLAVGWYNAAMWLLTVADHVRWICALEKGRRRKKKVWLTQVRHGSSRWRRGRDGDVGRGRTVIDRRWCCLPR
jgi:hypothetical protein